MKLLFKCTKGIFFICVNICTITYGGLIAIPSEAVASPSLSFAPPIHLIDYYRPDDRGYQSWGNEHTSNGDFYMIVHGHSAKNAPVPRPQSWLVRKQNANTSAFVDVDVFELAPGAHARPMRSHVDSSDNIYVSGWAADEKGTTHAILRKGVNGTWTTVDDFVVADGVNTVGYRVTTRGSLVAYAGYSLAPQSRAFVRLSEDNGNTWRTVLLQEYAGADASGAYCVILSATGDIFTLGIGDTNAGAQKTFIHRSQDGGISWLTSEQEGAADFTCLETVDGRLFVAGSKTADQDPENLNWHVMYSADGGDSWIEVQNENREGNEWAYIHGLAEDSLGNVYAAIPYGHTNDIQKTLIRVVGADAHSWSDYAEYSGSSGRDQAAIKGFSLWKDQIFVTGYEFLKEKRSEVGAFAIGLPSLAAKMAAANSKMPSKNR